MFTLRRSSQAAQAVCNIPVLSLFCCHACGVPELVETWVGTHAELQDVLMRRPVPCKLLVARVLDTSARFTASMEDARAAEAKAQAQAQAQAKAQAQQQGWQGLRLAGGSADGVPKVQADRPGVRGNHGAPRARGPVAKGPVHAVHGSARRQFLLRPALTALEARPGKASTVEKTNAPPARVVGAGRMP